MQLVESWEQVEANIRTLEAARSTDDVQLASAYATLIKLGTCFVTYQSSSGVAFAPSKFIGYVDNDMESHLKVRGKRDGRETNVALEDILESRPEADAAADALYGDFCRSLGFEPRRTGTFGVARKFWVSGEVLTSVESAAVAAIETDVTLTKTEKEQLVKARVGQGEFRKDVIFLWGACCLSGCAALKMLRASHIKPWSKSDNRERLDKFNGLLLTPNADALFDQGYISFSGDGQMLISGALSDEESTMLLAGCERKIKVYDANRPYLEYHKAYRFRGGQR